MIFEVLLNICMHASEKYQFGFELFITGKQKITVYMWRAEKLDSVSIDCRFGFFSFKYTNK